MVTLDHIFASDGNQLTDEELEHLQEVVTNQKLARSALNGDIDFDKSQGQYTTRTWDKQTRRSVDLNLSYQDAMELSLTGKLPGIDARSGVRCVGNEPRQYKFIRLSLYRLGKVKYALDALGGTCNKSNVIDLPTAKYVLTVLQNRVECLSKIYEEAADKLIKRYEKQCL